MRHETFFFVKQILKNPKQISAIAPSSAALGRAMATQIPAGATYIAEFGAGTGKITQGILNAGIAPQNLTCLEINPDFVALLREKFPAARVLDCYAQQMPPSPNGPYDAILSSLPLLSMDFETQEGILDAAFRNLGPTAPYIQFTYGLNNPVDARILKKLGLTFTRSRRIWNNAPPAVVYSYRRA